MSVNWQLLYEDIKRQEEQRAGVQNSYQQALRDEAARLREAADRYGGSTAEQQTAPAPTTATATTPTTVTGTGTGPSAWRADYAPQQQTPTSEAEYRQALLDEAQRLRALADRHRQEAGREPATATREPRTQEGVSKKISDLVDRDIESKPTTTVKQRSPSDIEEPRPATTTRRSMREILGALAVPIAGVPSKIKDTVGVLADYHPFEVKSPSDIKEEPGIEASLPEPTSWTSVFAGVDQEPEPRPMTITTRDKAATQTASMFESFVASIPSVDQPREYKKVYEKALKEAELKPFVSAEKGREMAALLAKSLSIGIEMPETRRRLQEREARIERDYGGRANAPVLVQLGLTLEEAAIDSIGVLATYTAAYRGLDRLISILAGTATKTLPLEQVASRFGQTTMEALRDFYTKPAAMKRILTRAGEGAAKLGAVSAAFGIVANTANIAMGEKDLKEALWDTSVRTATGMVSGFVFGLIESIIPEARWMLKSRKAGKAVATTNISTGFADYLQTDRGLRRQGFDEVEPGLYRNPVTGDIAVITVKPQGGEEVPLATIISEMNKGAVNSVGWRYDIPPEATITGYTYRKPELGGMGTPIRFRKTLPAGSVASPRAAGEPVAPRVAPPAPPVGEPPAPATAPPGGVPTQTPPPVIHAPGATVKDMPNSYTIVGETRDFDNILHRYLTDNLAPGQDLSGVGTVRGDPGATVLKFKDGGYYAVSETFPIEGGESEALIVPVAEDMVDFRDTEAVPESVPEPEAVPEAMASAVAGEVERIMAAVEERGGENAVPGNKFSRELVQYAEAVDAGLPVDDSLLVQTADAVHGARKYFGDSQVLDAVEGDLADKGWKIIDPTGEPYDKGLAYNLVHNMDMDAPTEDFFVYNTIKPIITKDNKVVRFGEVVIAADPGGRTEAPAPEAVAEVEVGVGAKPLVPLSSGTEGTTVTENHTEVAFNYAVVELDDLVVSHDLDFKVNPEYPAELQPRDRERVSSLRQVQGMVARFQPEWLGENAIASFGAPIVSPVDSVVEAGNGRCLALGHIYESEKHRAVQEEYRAWLKDSATKFGYDASAVDAARKPVLVRVRATEVDRAAFAEEANIESLDVMSPSEQAAVDAKKLTGEVMSLFNPTEDGRIDHAGNRDFIYAFMEQVVPRSQWPELVDKDGALAKKGLERVVYAVFFKAYGNPEVLARLAEDTDDNVRNIINGMVIASQKMAYIKEGIARGELYDADLSSEITEAVTKISDLRRTGTPVQYYLTQDALFDDGVSATARNVIAMFDRYKRSAKKIGELLTNYAEALEEIGSPKQIGLFGDVEPPSKSEILEGAMRKVDGVAYDGEQVTLFAPATGTGTESGVAVDEAGTAGEEGEGEVTGAGGGRGRRETPAETTEEAPEKTPKVEEPEAPKPSPVKATGEKEAKAGGSALSDTEEREEALEGVLPGDVPEARGEGRTRRGDTPRDKGREGDDGDDAATPSAGKPSVGDREGARDPATRKEGTERLGEPRSVTQQNILITEREAHALGSRSTRDKTRDNIEAIRVLKMLEEDGRPATPREQQILVKYVGWGFNKGLFNAEWCKKHGYEEEYRALKDLLTKEEYEAARSSVLFAHYTTPEIVRAMYDVLASRGFDGGNVLEPAMGSGLFYAMMPRNIMQGSTLTGVEIDPITGGIAKLLFPRVSVNVMGYEEFDVPYNREKLLNEGKYDLVISNVPFSDVPPAKDVRYRKVAKSLHNYFFAKAIDHVRPGGVVMFITSRYTMDSRNKTFRNYVEAQADFLGAVRLHNEAFKGIAETRVVADIIFLRKRMDGDPSRSVPWAELSELQLTDKDGFLVPCFVNEYFVNNPGAVIGKHVLGPGLYGRNEYQVVPDGPFLGDGIRRHFASVLPADAYMPRPVPPALDADAAPVKEALLADPGTLLMSYIVRDGELFQAQENKSGELILVPASELELTGAGEKRIRGMVKIRDAYIDLINKEMTDAPEKEIARSREKLNRVYDAFVKRWKAVSDRYNRVFIDDPYYYRIIGLEVVDDVTGKLVKNTIFTKRAIARHAPAETAKTADEALLHTLNEKGKIDLQHIAKLVDKPEDQVIEELGDAIFYDPEGGWTLGNTYLSGNVREKLRIAEEHAAKDAVFKRNVEALRRVLPAEKGPDTIHLSLGAAWVPRDIVRNFILHVFDHADYRNELEIEYSKEAGSWFIRSTPDLRRRFRKSPQNARHGLSFKDSSGAIITRDALTIIERMLNSKPMTVTYNAEGPGGKVTRRTHGGATVAMGEKARRLDDLFREWAWGSKKIAGDLIEIYNWQFNNLVKPEYNGDHLTFPGMSRDIVMDPHQKSAVWQILQANTGTLVHHAVGSGKTFVMVASAMEMRRLGLCNKPMLTAPNHLVGEIYNQARQLYPSAKIATFSTADMVKSKRREVLGQIAAGDYDLIIIPHSSFGMIPVSASFLEKIKVEEVGKIMRAIAKEKAITGKGDTAFAREMERAARAMEKKMQDAIDRTRANQDEGFIPFSELGVDALFVDEAHNFKNLFFTSRMGRIGNLGTQEGSNMAFDLYSKLKYLRERRGSGKGIAFFTATPISNTIAEVYNMQRYLAPEVLDAAEIFTFDAWAKLYGEVVTAVELKPSGKGYQAKDRFRRFTSNITELMMQYHQFANVVNRDKMVEISKDILLPQMVTGDRIMVVSPVSQELSTYIDGLDARLEAIKAGEDPKIDNTLKVMTDGRMAALFGPLRGLPDYRGSKVSKVVEKVLELWDKYEEERLTQVVFLDLGTPKARTSDEEGESYVPTAEEAEDNIEVENLERGVYGIIEQRLVAKGVPKSEIAVIHDYPTPDDKQRLFREMRTGAKRILIGSTGKMGEGMNIQSRLVALHHVDAPWKPSIMEQREGRIIRRGNMNKEVYIYTYATEATLDTFLWQTLEQKQGFLTLFEDCDLGIREAEDVDDAQASYAMLKALATGNPLIVEHANLRHRVMELRAMEQSFLGTEAWATTEIAEARELIKRNTGFIAGLEAAIRKRVDIKGNKFKATLFGKVYTDRKAAGEVLVGNRGPLKEAISLLTGDMATSGLKTGERELYDKVSKIPGISAKLETVKIMSLMGLVPKEVLTIDVGSVAGFTLALKKMAGEAPRYHLTDFADGRSMGLRDTPGWMMRSLENALYSAEGDRDNLAAEIVRAEKEIAGLEKQLGGTFEQREELRIAEERIAELELALGMREEEPAAGRRKMEEYKVKDLRGETVVCEGYEIAPGLAAVDLDAVWSVTHVPSGKAIGFFSSEGLAREAAAKIAELGSWNVELKTLSPRLIEQALTVINEYGERDLTDSGYEEVADSAFDALADRNRDYSYEVLDDKRHAPEQTSRKQVSRGLSLLCNRLPAAGLIEKPAFVFDQGGGLYDDGIAYGEKQGVEIILWDPEARSVEYNEAALARLEEIGKAPATCCSNVLNVLEDYDARQDVIQFGFNETQVGGHYLITVYSGNGSGKTSYLQRKDAYNVQLNRKTKDYIPEIREALGSAAEIEYLGKHNCILITKKRELGPDLSHKGKALEADQELAASPSREYRAIRPGGRVGKRVRGNTWYHETAWSGHADPEEKKLIKGALKLIPAGHPYDIVRVNTKDGTVAFLQSDNFDKADEPTQTHSTLVRADGSVSSTAGGSTIYHHKWMMVADNYRGFDVEESKERSEWWENAAIERGLKVDRNKIGHRASWDKFLEKVDDAPTVLDMEAAPTVDNIRKVNLIPSFLSGRMLKQRATNRRAIADRISKMVSTYTGHVRGRARKAFYSREEYYIRVKVDWAKDIETLSHELGHYLTIFTGMLRRKFIMQAMSGKLGKDAYKIITAELVNSPYVQETLLVENESASFSLQIHEGAADFILHYFNDPEAAQKLFPHTMELFGIALDLHPDLRAGVDEIRDMYDEYFRLDGPALVGGFIEPQAQGTGVVQRVKDAWSKVFYMVFDEGARIAHFVEQLYGGGRAAGYAALDKLNPGRNPHVLSRSAKGAPMAVHQMIKPGGGQYRVNWETGKVKKVGASLYDILAPVKDLGTGRTFLEKKAGISGRTAEGASHWVQFTHWIVSKRAIYIEEVKGLKSGMNERELAAARELVEFVEAQPYAEVYEKVADDVREWSRFTVSLLRDAGVIDDGTYQRFTADEVYVPFLRYDESRRLQGLASEKKGSRGKGIKGMRGADLPIRDPWKSLMRQAMLFKTLADANRTGLALVDVEEADNALLHKADFFTKIPTPMTLTQVSLREFLDQMGVSVENDEFLDGLGTLISDMLEAGDGFDMSQVINIFRPKQFGDVYKNTLTFWRDGKPEFYEFKDKELMSALMGLDREQMGLLTKLCRPFSKMLRVGATWNPRFIINNPWRDQIIVWAYSTFGYLPFWDLFKGVSAIVGVKPESEEFIALGGGMSVLNDVDTDYLKRGYNQVITSQYAEMVKASINPLEPLGRISSHMEYGTNVGVYIRAKKSGLHPLIAVHAATDCTVHHGVAGSKMWELASKIPFLKSFLYGQAKFLRELKHNPWRVILRCLVGITLPTLLLYLVNRTNPNYHELPAWRKNHFWSIPMGDPRSTKWFFPMPKPFLQGIIFGALPETVVRQLDEEGRADWGELGRSIRKEITPNFVPAVVLPLIELFGNKNMYTGAPIVPVAEEYLPAEHQFGPYTSEVAKLIGRTFRISPRKIDHLTYGYTAGLGRNLIKGADSLLYLSGVADKSSKPAGSNRDVPFVGDFLSTPTASGSAAIERFYTEYGKLQEFEARVIAKGESGKMPVLSDKDKEKIRKVGLYRAIARDMSEVRGIIRKVRELPPEKEHMTLEERQEIMGTLVYTRPDGKQGTIKVPRYMSPEDKRMMIDYFENIIINMARQLYGEPVLPPHYDYDK